MGVDFKDVLPVQRIFDKLDNKISAGWMNENMVELYTNTTTEMEKMVKGKQISISYYSSIVWFWNLLNAEYLANISYKRFRYQQQKEEEKKNYN